MISVYRFVGVVKLHTCQLSRFRRETPDFEDFSRSPDRKKKSYDVTV